MAITVTRREFGRVVMGQAGKQVETGCFVFTTTDTTGSLPIAMKRITSIHFQVVGVLPATDEQVGTTETMNGNNEIIVPSTGKIAVGRTGASPTSGLKVFYRAEGE